MLTPFDYNVGSCDVMTYTLKYSDGSDYDTSIFTFTQDGSYILTVIATDAS